MEPLWTRRWLRLLTAGLIVTVLSTAVPAAAGSGGPDIGGSPPGGVAGVAVPRLAWQPCGNGAPEEAQCATAKVPLDYRRPHWRTIDIAVGRLPALDPKHRIGSLFLDPGGPGGSGLEVLGDPSVFPTRLRERFDIVGFDPRGVGRSSQVVCWSPKRYLREYAQATGRAAGGHRAFRKTVAQAKQFDAACRQHSGELLPYLGTAYVARDLDLLRAAVGDRKLSYLGVSYGTYLGNVYAAMFPDRVRALALDSPFDPVAYTHRPLEYVRRHFVAADAALRRVFDWCVATPDACSFGDGNPVAAWHRLIARLDTTPITVTGEEGFTVTTNASLLSYIVSIALFDGRQIWPVLMDALDQLATTGDGALVDFFGSDVYAFLSPNGAIDCADTAAGYPDELGRLERSLVRDVAEAPLLGGGIAYGPPSFFPHAPLCTVWSSRSVSRYEGSFQVRNVPPALVIGITGDPVTDYPSALTMTRLVGGRLLTVEGEGHVAFTENQCAGEHITTYLVDRTLPPPGTVCADEA